MGEQKHVFLSEMYATYVGTAVGVRPSVVGDGTIDMSLNWATPKFDPSQLVTDNHGPEGLRAVMPLFMVNK